jgi:outer membrane receptor protein involved in Fe transport
MLKARGEDIKGKIVCISGSGNVAQYAVEKMNQLGGKVVTLSDSNGSIYDPDGISGEKFDFILDLKQIKRGRIKEYAEEFNVEYRANNRPWDIKCDIAMPCATQNEIELDDDPRAFLNDSSVSRSYTEILPSVNLKYQITDWLDIRAAATKTLNRPRFIDLIPFERIDFDQQTV